MSTIYPDVNKYYQGDSNLCWAAACANALVWTGWNQAIAAARGVSALDEEGIYDIYRLECPRGISDQGWEAIDAIDWILKYHRIRIPLLKVAQSRSPSDFFLANSILSRPRNCVILGIWTITPKGKVSAHALTNYVTFHGDRGNGDNDPRRVSEIVYTDSDDARGDRTVHKQIRDSLPGYEVSEKQIYLTYKFRVYRINRWYSVLQNPSST